MGRHTHERSHIADTAVPLRSQMLVRMNAATAGGETRLLADGNQVPVLGLGVWQVRDGPEGHANTNDELIAAARKQIAELQAKAAGPVS
jgi:hypothetical protein